MKTNVKDSSLDAFFAIKHSPALQDQERKIIKVMEPYKVYTRRQLAKLTKLETSTVSARVNGMLDTFIEVVGHIKDPITNRLVEALTLKAPVILKAAA